MNQPSAHPAPRAPSSTRAVAHAFDLGGDAIEWVQLLPSGSFQGADGRGPYRSDAEAVLRRTAERSGGNDLAIDYGHALEREGPEGDAAPAAGWLGHLEVRNGGEVWGHATWTTEGARRVRDKEYRFLSPVFYHDPAGNVLYLLRAGLTNRPNLAMAAIHSSGPGAGREDTVVTDFARIAGALGMSATADENAIIARCSTVTAAEAGRARVAAALQLQAGATDDQVVSAIHALRTPDPARFVPVETHQQVATTLKALQAKQGEADVDAVIAARKLVPAQRDWALAYHARDPEGFAAFAAAQPVVMGEAPNTEGQPSGGDQATLTDDEKAVCANMGVSEADFVKNRGS